jgi:hypothetical protein
MPITRRVQVALIQNIPQSRPFTRDALIANRHLQVVFLFNSHGSRRSTPVRMRGEEHQ